MPSQSQASTLVNRGGRAATGAPASGAMARRRATRSDGAGSGKQKQTMNYYTDDSPGVKISPVFVIGMSLFFIFAVTVLHVVAKLRG